MSETVILVPEPEPDPSPEPAADHGIEIGRLQAENEELRKKVEEMESRLTATEHTANEAVDIALSQPEPDIALSQPELEPEPDWETFRDPAYEEDIIALFAEDEEEEEAVIVEEPPVTEEPKEAPIEKKKGWWII